MPVLQIIGWKEGLRKISMTELLKARLEISLTHAKRITDEVMDGKVIFINIDDRESAESLANELFELGAIVKITE